jgi:hypothetical protein
MRRLLLGIDRKRVRMKVPSPRHYRTSLSPVDTPAQFAKKFLLGFFGLSSGCH